MKFLLPLVLATAVTTPAIASPFQDPAAFEKGLASVERSMDQGRWEKASKALISLLEKNVKAEYVYMEQSRILQDMERITLFMTYEAPTADDVLAGDVKKYDADKGRIEATFFGTDLSDLIENNGAYTLPVNFTGSYTIEMSGARYPVADPLSIVIGWTTANEWRITFGGQEYKPYVAWYPLDADAELLETSEKQPVSMGQPYTFLIDVKGTKVNVKVNKKKLFALKRPKDDYGKAAFYGLRDYERESLKIVVKGEIEPSWIAGKIDEVMQERMGEFEASYDPASVLPEWLFDEYEDGDDDSSSSDSSGSSGGSLRDRVDGNRPRKSDAESDGSGSFSDYPCPKMDIDGASAFADLTQEYFSGDNTLDEMLEMIDDAEAEEGLSDVASDFIRMHVLAAYGLLEEAAAAGERMIPSATDHQTALISYANILVRTREFDRAREILHAARAKWPKSWEVVEALVDVEVFGQNMEAAQDLVREARVKKFMGKGGEDLEAQIDKAISGPHWPKTYTFKSKHYIIESDISEALCKEAAGLLEGAYTSYSVRLKRIKGLENNKFRVFIFSGEPSYQRYVGESLGASAENTLGLYSGFMKQLLIWNAPERDSMMRTVVHEGFHQYLDLAAYRVPRWFNEGMAEYIETSEVINGRWTDGQVRHDHLEVLKEYDVMPLESIITMTYQDFASGHVYWHYSNSWALIHFLRNSTKENEAIFDAMFKGFLESPSSRRVIKSAFEGVDLEKLDRDFQEYLVELREQ